MCSSAANDFEWQVLPLCDDSAKQQTVTQLMIKRRVLRANVQHFDPPVMLGNLGAVGEMFRIKTIAEFGAAIYHEGRDLANVVGRDHNCWISVADVKIPVICRIRYLTAELAGIEFITPSPDIRLLLRTHFFFELMTAKLTRRAGSMPTMSGPSAKVLTYGDETSHGAEVRLQEGRLDGFKIALGPIGAEVCWRNGEAIRVFMKSGECVDLSYLRLKLVGFLRNLPGLNPRIREAIELVTTKAKIEVAVV